MKRVTKRLLLHNSRENEDIKESDLDELKQHFHALKLDVFNDIKRMKENIIQYSSVLFKGLTLLGDCFNRERSQELDLDLRYRKFRSFDMKFQLDMKKLQESNKLGKLAN
jgi:hypothetical protein